MRGALVHNLNHIDVDLTRDAVVVFTGIFASGKSSLDFGTLILKSQRRCLDLVSLYARPLIDQVAAPDVDAIRYTGWKDLEPDDLPRRRHDAPERTRGRNTMWRPKRVLAIQVERSWSPDRLDVAFVNLTCHG